jgi:hypothetical protein
MKEKIIKEVVGARKVGECGGEFRKEGKVMFLARGERCASFGNSSNERFVSVKRVKGRPSRKKRKWRTER